MNRITPNAATQRISLSQAACADTPPAPSPEPNTERAASLLTYLHHHFREYGMLVILLAIMLFFQWATEGKLLAPVNITNLILQNSYIVIMALGMLLVIVAGHIDLSVGSVSGFIGAFAAVLMVQQGWSPLLAALACLACGGLIGGVQGYFIAYHRVPAFIVTLGGLLVFKGLALWALQGQSVGPFPESFQLLSARFVPGWDGLEALFPPPAEGEEGLRWTSLLLALLAVAAVVLLAVYSWFQQRQKGMEMEPALFFFSKIALASLLIAYLAWLLAGYRGLPNVLIVMASLILFYEFVTSKTTLGRRVYALGGNEKAAKLSGINTERVALFSFINMGVLAALAGLIFAARLNTATPKAGAGFELDVIAACFIGGVSATGGVGRVMGAVTGAFVMGVMNNGMSILGVGIDYQQIIKGLVLFAAVFVDVYSKNRS